MRFIFAPLTFSNVFLYQVGYGRLMDAKTWPLIGLYILRFIHFQKVFIPALNPNTVPTVHTVARR